MRNLLASTLALVLLANGGAAIAADVTELIVQATQGDNRSEKNRARDIFRHPVETLNFFGWQPQMTVLEIYPGTGWYTEILAPLARPQGQLYAANFALTADDLPSYGEMVQKIFVSKLEARPDVYDHVVVTELSVPQRVTPAPPGSADMVLTFRNLHNWVRADEAAEMMAILYRALKPGGVFGLVDHRGKAGISVEQMARSPINDNAADIEDYPDGVWSLSPSLRTCKKIEAAAEKTACEERYRAIGESDRMTLRFRKPA